VLIVLVVVLIAVVVAAQRRQPGFRRPTPARGGLPSPGWYQDPSQEAPFRWWSGEVWTASTATRTDAARPTATVSPLPKPALAWAIGAVACAVVVVAGFTFTYRHIARPPAIPGLLLYFACLYGVLFGACRGFSLRHGSGSLAADFGLDLRLRDSYRGLGIFFVANIASAIAVAPFIHQSHLQGTNTQALTNYRHQPAVFVVVTLIATVAAPFFEELFFRGLLFRALLGRMRPGWALVIQAAVFGSAHYNPYQGSHNVSVIAAITAMGIVLGWSALHFQRLGPGMVAHFLKNVTAVLAILAMQS
jgi:membrane protease YdiL (CAAX protease family)